MNLDRPIALFDSGVGGLTVMSAIASLLPHENLIYFGDTARVPYGNRSPATIRQYSLESAQFLLLHQAKALVVACHTACSNALAELQTALPIPVIGVSEPGVDLLLKTTGSKKVAILGTRSTIQSPLFPSLIRAKNPTVKAEMIACPLFVPLVEEEMHTHLAAKMIVEHYLSPYANQGIDAALLACTHYPLLAPLIQEVFGNATTLVDPAQATALALRHQLAQSQLLRSATTPPTYRFFVSDAPEKFNRLASLFFARPISPATHVFLEKYGLERDNVAIR